MGGGLLLAGAEGGGAWRRGEGLRQDGAVLVGLHSLLAGGVGGQHLVDPAGWHLGQQRALDDHLPLQQSPPVTRHQNVRLLERETFHRFNKKLIN